MWCEIDGGLTKCAGHPTPQNQNEQEVGTGEFVGQALLDVHDAMLYSKKLYVKGKNIRNGGKMK